MAVVGDYALVGRPYTGTSGPNAQPGALYVFKRDGAEWAQIDRILPAESAGADLFGYAVAADGDYAVVGAPGAGAAYVFRRRGDAWEQQQRLTQAATGSFGWAVDVSGTSVIVGAPTTGGAAVNAGAAFVYVRGGAAWALQARLATPALQAQDRVGTAVAIDGDRAVVGTMSFRLRSKWHTR